MMNIEQKVVRNVFTKICDEAVAISWKQFVSEIATLNNSKEDMRFNVSSVDTGSVFFSMSGCQVSVTDNAELMFFKPGTAMEVDIDFDIIKDFYKEGNSYRLEFDNGMTDIIIVDCAR